MKSMVRLPWVILCVYKYIQKSKDFLHNFQHIIDHDPYVFSHSDGKMYDAYVSYTNEENDQKFVNFILKPHLENKYGHKLLLNNTNILPGAGISLRHERTECVTYSLCQSGKVIDLNFQ